MFYFMLAREEDSGNGGVKLNERKQEKKVRRENTAPLIEGRNSVVAEAKISGTCGHHCHYTLS